jgi:hypothetical protein
MQHPCTRTCSESRGYASLQAMPDGPTCEGMGRVSVTRYRFVRAWTGQ